MTIALVSGQVISGVSAGSATVTVTLPNNPTTGNFVAVGFFITAASNTGQTFTVKDSANNSYTATTASPAFNSGPGGFSGIFYLPNAPASATKGITCTISAGTGTFVAHAAEYSGVQTTTPLERDTSAGTSFGTTFTAQTLTTTNNGDLLFSVAANGAGTITTANSPWTGVSTLASGDAYAEYFIQATAGARAVNYTSSSAGNWAGVEAAFIAAVTDTLFAQSVF